jgi:queuine tRNA-ribosyltransferase
MPTRAGRHGLAYTRFGKINLKNARHADDPRPLDETSDCPAAQRLQPCLSASSGQGGRGARGHAADLEQSRLLPKTLMQGIRDAIEAGSFQDFRAATREGWARGDIAPRD